MKIYEIFSKRQKRIRGEVPDVYQYETIPPELRVQVIHIWRDIWGKKILETGYHDNPCYNAYRAYKTIHDGLCREYGRFELSEDRGLDIRVCKFLLNTKETEKVIDVIELSFRLIDQWVRNNPHLFSPLRISPDDAIRELNNRFHEHGVGYHYEFGRIIKVDSQFIHSKVVKAALSLLSDPMYEGANEEFLSAHKHYRERNYKDCVTNCHKALESCLKTICEKRGWEYDDSDSFQQLIKIIFDQELIPPLMQAHFAALRSTLEAGVPPVRNKLAAHGQGSKEKPLPDYIASYIIHLTASNILLLARANQEEK